MSRMCARITSLPPGSTESRCSTIRPPSGSDSKTCEEVYWSTPIALAPRAWRAANAESAFAAASSRGAPGHPRRTATHPEGVERIGTAP